MTLTINAIYAKGHGGQFGGGKSSLMAPKGQQRGRPWGEIAKVPVKGRRRGGVWASGKIGDVLVKQPCQSDEQEVRIFFGKFPSSLPQCGIDNARINNRRGSAS